MPPPPPTAAEPIPLPKCSVVFFHHVEKTGGTTLRSIFQRHQQLGLWDLVSFVGRQNRLQLQIILHRLDVLRRTPGGLDDLRLAVELHVGGDVSFPYTLFYTLPDLLYMREQLRAAGCRCHLVSLVRLPLLQELSWHSHFVNAKAPLCFWRGASDCSTRMALGLTCHDVPRLRELGERHRTAMDGMWRLFDLVGVTEYFDEFVLRLADVVGLPHPAYTAQLVDASSRRAQILTTRAGALRRWSTHTCAGLLKEQSRGRPLPRGLLQLVERHLNASRAQMQRADHPERRMECRNYGCVLPRAMAAARPTRASPTAAFTKEACAKATPIEVLQRVCGRVALDDAIYQSVRRRFLTGLRAALSPALLEERLQRLRGANEALQQRALSQQARPRRRLFRRGGGGDWARRSATASTSCVGCSGDVVPEFDLGGCWPLWAQFAPDELRYQCRRNWTIPPDYGRQHSRAVEVPNVFDAPLACWRTCWTPIKADWASGTVKPTGDAPFCTAPCPGPAAAGAPSKPAEWRRGWDDGLNQWRAQSAAGSALRSLEALFQADARGGWHQSYRTRQIFKVF